MTQTHSHSPTTLGFLTVVEMPSLGPCGGLLVVSQIGRPIEFHCTAPVRPNRAQEIMYGQTFKGFMFADQIGMALIDKLNRPPTLFLTDCPDVLPVSEQVDSPLLLVDDPNRVPRFDGRGLRQLTLGGETVYCANVQSDAVDELKRTAELFTRTLPLEEPFERIRQAIEEAHQVLRAA